MTSRDANPGEAGQLPRPPAPDHGVFAISVAAELTGLHPQTLRIYEREGLLSPSRSDGGTRKYSQNDVERLRVIAGLMDSGMNIAGVRRVLELEKENRDLRRQLDEQVSGYEGR
jgi:MerR family transcriptional regulator, heat shock protein HspR